MRLACAVGALVLFISIFTINSRSLAYELPVLFNELGVGDHLSPVECVTKRSMVLRF